MNRIVRFCGSDLVDSFSLNLKNKPGQTNIRIVWELDESFVQLSCAWSNEIRIDKSLQESLINVWNSHQKESKLNVFSVYKSTRELMGIVVQTRVSI